LYSVLSYLRGGAAAAPALAAARSHARGQAQPLYNPELELAYENALSTSKEVGLSQTLDLGGKRGARAGVADAELAAAQTRLAISTKALTTELLTALAGHRAASAADAAARQRVDLDREFLALAERRNRAGDLPLTELLTARLSLSQAQAEASVAALALSDAQERLNAIAGAAAPPPPTLGTAPDAPARALDGIDVMQLPEMRLAAREAEAARSRIGVAKRGRVPDPTLGLSIGKEREWTPLGTREAATTFGLRLSIPIPVRNGYGAQVDTAGANLIAAEEAMRRQRRVMEARIVASRQRYETAQAAWADWRDEGAASLDDQRTLLRRLWDAGEIGAVDYIIQLNQTFATQRAGIELEARLWTAWFDWLDATATIGDWMEIAP
jgi:cobalt-zinc-cadmium efflux system outer membrane protein